MRRFITILTAVAVSAGIGLVAPPAEAKPPAPVVQSSIAVPAPTRPLTARAKKDIRVAYKIKKAAQRGKVLDYRKARKVTKNVRILKAYVRGVRLGGGRVIHGPGPSPALNAVVPFRAGCPGVNDIKAKPYGWRIRLDACKSAKLEAVAVSGAAIVALLATVVPMPNQAKLVLAVAEFVFIWGAVWTAVCNYHQRGVKIYYVTLPGTVFCRSQ